MKPLGVHLRQHPAVRAWMGLLPLVAALLMALAVFALTLRALARSVPEAHAEAPGASGAPADPPAGTRRSPAGMQRLDGTVMAVDRSGRSLDLLTGVGLALRIHRVHLPDPLRVRGVAPESATAALTRGCIVRVECQTTTAGTYASTVELMRAAPAGVKP